MEILSDSLEKYMIMANVFFKHLDGRAKVDALTEAAEQIREELFNNVKNN